MSWSLACPDWEQRLREGRSLVPSLPLDQAKGDTAVAVFNKLRLPDVPGQPTMAEAAGDWFRDIVRALFGSLDPLTGERHIRELLLLVPKKNSKTTNGALLMLTALLVNLRPRAKFILTGPTQDIADLAFSQVKGAIELDPTLSKLLKPRDHLKKIEHLKSGAELEIMTFDPNVLTGQKPAGILIDELHVSAKMAKAASALRQLRGGMLAMPESFLAFITTQSEEPPVGVFRAELTKARAIRDGRLEAAMLPVLYEFPEAMQRDRTAWRNPANWPMVTPNNGRSIRVERLVQDFKVAESVGEGELRAWASQHLNLEIGLALHTDRWRGADYWEAAGEDGLTLQQLLARCDVVTVGIDGGGLDDLLALAVIGREIGTRRWLLWVRAWAHVDVKELRKSEASRLEEFEADGDLVFVEDLADANAQLAGVVQSIEESGLMNKVGIDMYGCTDALDALAQVDIAGDDKVAGISQGWKLNSIIKAMEVRLSNRTLAHGQQRLMAWCVGNAKVVPAGNAISITKQAAGTAKIDPLVAAFCAGTLMNANPEAAGAITQGFVVL